MKMFTAAVRICAVCLESTKNSGQINQLSQQDSHHSTITLVRRSTYSNDKCTLCGTVFNAREDLEEAIKAKKRVIIEELTIEPITRPSYRKAQGLIQEVLDLDEELSTRPVVRKE